MSRSPRAAGPARLALCALLALLLTLSLTVASLSAVLWRLDAPGSLYQHVTDAALDLQEHRIREQIRTLAEAYHFGPEPVLALFPRERLQALNAQAVAWWRQLLQDDPALIPPVFSDSAVAALVRDDPGFQAVTEPTLRRIVAEDRVAYVICETVQHAVYPVRTPLVSVVLPRLAQRVDLPRLMPMLRMIPLAGLVASLLTGLAIALLLLRSPDAACFIGSALIAASVLTLLGLLAVHLLDLAGQAGLVSHILATELSVLGRELALIPGLAAGVMLAAGLTLHTIGWRLAARR